MSLLLKLLADVVLLLELFDTAAAVYELLLSGEERMALRAYVEPDLRLVGLGHEGVSAGTSYLAVHIFGMNSVIISNFLLVILKTPCYCSTRPELMQALFRGKTQHFRGYTACFYGLTALPL